MFIPFLVFHFPYYNTKVLAKVLFRVKEGIIPVISDEKWGSGLVYDKNYVITCSHVITDSNFIFIRDIRDWLPVSICYTLPNRSSWDFSLLHSSKQLYTRPLSFNSNFQTGGSIRLQGYGLFQP